MGNEGDATMLKPQNGEERRSANIDISQLANMITDHIEKLYEQGQTYNAQMLANAVEASRREREFESKRIDALLTASNTAVSVANDRAIKQADLLNASMLENAEVLRKSVEATAVTIAAQFDKITGRQDERIAALELINSKNLGAASATPNMSELVNQLIAAQNISKGASSGRKDLWALIVGGVLFLFAIITFVADRV